MRKGYPFETDEFLAQRERQRRELRLVPNWVMSKAMYVPPPHEREADVLVEHELRRLADDAREALPKGLVSKFAEHSGAEAAAAFMRNEWESLGLTSAHSFSDLNEQLWTRLNDVAVTDLPDGVPLLVARWVHLLVWADEKAPDGYRDPRLLA